MGGNEVEEQVEEDEDKGGLGGYIGCGVVFVRRGMQSLCFAFFFFFRFVVTWLEQRSSPHSRHTTRVGTLASFRLAALAPPLVLSSRLCSSLFDSVLMAPIPRSEALRVDDPQAPREAVVGAREDGRDDVLPTPRDEPGGWNGEEGEDEAEVVEAH